MNQSNHDHMAEACDPRGVASKALFVPRSLSVGTGGGGRFRTQMMWWLCAVGIAYLALLPQFYNLTNPETRFSAKWNWSHYGAIVSAILAVAFAYGLAAGCLSWILKRWRYVRLRRGLHIAYAWLVLCIGIRCVTSILDRSLEWPVFQRGGLLHGATGSVLLYGLLPGLVWIMARSRFRQLAKRLCSLGFILFVVFCVTALGYTRYSLEWDLPPLPPVEGSRLPGPPNVFVVIFDEWSYPLTYPQGKPRDDLPNLSAFSETAHTFHRHVAPGATTMASISRFLFQRNAAFVATPYQNVIDILRSNQQPDGPNIFTGHESHFRAIFGSHLDYRLLVGQDAEYTASVPFLDTMTSFGQRTLDLLLSQVAWSRHLGVPVWRLIEPNRGGGIRRLEWMTSTLYALAERTRDEPVFAFCHLLIPHYPYAWDANGVISRMGERTLEERYLGNLRYMDTVLGRFVERLQQAGTYDHSLLIITSDHSWREDPLLSGFNYAEEDAKPDSRLKHVPLLIKHPGQRDPVDVWDTFHSVRLYELIERFLNPASGETAADETETMRP